MCPRGRPRGQGRPRGLHLCNRYLGDKYFDMVWGTTFLGTPSNGSPKINFFNGSSWDVHFFFIPADV